LTVYNEKKKCIQSGSFKLQVKGMITVSDAVSFFLSAYTIEKGTGNPAALMIKKKIG